MFGIWKRKKPEVLQHWYSVLLDFETSTDEFYSAIEKDLDERQLKGLTISRVEFAEGGVLSAKREYLRMQRERLIFDVCSAPFGTSWFFSCRHSEIPATLRLWEVLVILLVLAAVGLFYVELFGLITGPVLFAASLLSILIVMRNTVALGLHDADAALLQIPVVGALYEAFLRKETYYREDTRLAYRDIVDGVIKRKIENSPSKAGRRRTR